MTNSSGAPGVRDEVVLRALEEAGWFEGRSVDVSEWVNRLGAAGFEISELAQKIWAEYGGLVISSIVEERPSELRIDPVDGCIDSLDEALILSEKLNDRFSPLGMWSVQFRTYIGGGGMVIAVGPGTLWHLGSSFESTLINVTRGLFVDEKSVRWVGGYAEFEMPPGQ